VDTDQIQVALRSSDPDVVFGALLQTQMFGPSSGGRFMIVMPDVIRLAGDPEDVRKVRQMALTTLAALAQEDDRARDVALSALNDPDAGIRQHGLMALIPFKNLRPADLSAIGQMVADSDKDVARWSEIALRSIAQRA